MSIWYTRGVRNNKRNGAYKMQTIKSGEFVHSKEMVGNQEWLYVKHAHGYNYILGNVPVNGVKKAILVDNFSVNQLVIQKAENVNIDELIQLDDTKFEEKLEAIYDGNEFHKTNGMSDVMDMLESAKQDALLDEEAYQNVKNAMEKLLKIK